MRECHKSDTVNSFQKVALEPSYKPPKHKPCWRGALEKVSC